MTPRRSASFSRFSAAALLSIALLLLGGLSAEARTTSKTAKAAKARAAAKAKAKAEASSSAGAGAKSSASSPTPYEVPSPGQPATPPASSGETSAKAAETSSGTGATSSTAAESTSAEATKELSSEASSTELGIPPETTTPLGGEAAPPAEPTPLSIEHLGPDTYPGQLRGIYGGSLWLEPSFHGLQWPYMPKSGVGVSGSFWVDNSYERIARDKMGDTAMWLQQGRGVLRVSPTYTNGSLFIQGQVELVGNMCQAPGMVCPTQGTFDTDDLWIRVGRWNAWDLKVGRFEAWELYHTGMGLDPYTIERSGASNFGMDSPSGLTTPDFYGVSWMHDRPTSGLGVGYLAFHAYPTNNFRFEMLGELGADSLDQDGLTYLGGRPAFIVDQGWMKVKFGAEYERATGATGYVDTNTGQKTDSKKARTRRGLGGALQFVIDPRAEFGANIAYGDQKLTPNPTDGTASATDSFTRISVGGFGNLRVGALWLLGVGANFTWQNDKFYATDSPSPDYTAHLQTFVALQYLLARQLYIKAVIGYARADFVASDAAIPVLSNYLYSGRIRLMYLY